MLVAGLLFLAAFQIDGDRRGFDLFLNLGTEVFGILITLAVVDWMLERRRRQERALDLAWATFHAVEQAVWVWQGGPRRVASDELLGIILSIDPNDELLPFTRSLLAAVGTRSLEVLDREARAVSTVSGLDAALKELTSLNALSNLQYSVSISMVGDVLHCATRGLARVLELSTRTMPSSLIRYRNAAADAQEERSRHLRRGLAEATEAQFTTART